MIEFLQSVGTTWGIGAVFAILMFFILMKAFRMMREDRKFMEDRLTGLVDKYDKTSRAQQRASNKAAKVMTELHTWLKARNGHR